MKTFLLISAIIFITLALIFYTIGVFNEKRNGYLLKWHLIVFWLGFVCDTIGTSLMAKISNSSSFQFNLHSITGLLALILMLIHAIWATFILIKNNEQSRIKFHKFSIFVWAIWLVPYFLGMILGMKN